jgi:predicted N-acetyltransferase YhbS
MIQTDPTPTRILRPLRPQDAEAVAELINTAFASITPPLVPQPSALRETAESVAKSIATGGAGVEENGRLIGAVLWEPRAGGLYFGRLSVAPTHRRQGIAQSLIAAAEAQARADGHPRIHAATRLALAGNRAMFKACGYTETDLHAHEGFDHPTWVDLEKHLV